MRILHLYNGGHKGGVQQLFQHVTYGLNTRNTEQFFLLGAQEPLPFSTENYKRLAFRNRFTNWKSHYQVQQTIKKFKPDIIQIWPHRAVWFAPPAKDIPVVAYIGGPTSAKRLQKFYANKTAILVPAQPTVEYLKQFKFIDNKVQVLQHFIPETKSLKHITIPQKPDAPLLLAIGRLSHEKGFDILINALKNIPHAHLWLAGSGPEQPALEALIAKHNLKKRVKFLGWCSDVSPLIKQADICIVPSREESFGLVILEAWQQQKPVIAAAAPGPNMLIQHQKNGLLVECDNIDALTKATQKLINTPEQQKLFGQHGYNTYQQHYTEDASLTKLLSFYRGLLPQEPVAQAA